MANGLLDFLQGASNAAASNVSAPVGGIAWLLRKAGIPVPEAPIGGSDWMAKKGLTAKPQNYLAGLLGESVGGVAPIVAAAKAPQIAKGLLQVEANAMAPSTLPRMNERGAIVFHGSPHKFDKFDASKIGTGEGAQAYGHGLYLAESPEVARSYQTALSPGGKSLSIDGARPVMDMSGSGGVPSSAAGKVMNQAIMALQQAKDVDKAIASAASPEVRAAIEKLRGRVQFSDPGSLYKVDLPDDKIARMLDWDKPLYRQSPAVRRAVRNVVDENTQPGTYAQWVKAARPDMRNLQNDMLEGMDNAAIAQALRGKGIPGIRYLDQGSRSSYRVQNTIKGQPYGEPVSFMTEAQAKDYAAEQAVKGFGTNIIPGTSNFVVFPGEEQFLRILERNGGLLGP
jgi:hypothetical protein